MELLTLEDNSKKDLKENLDEYSVLRNIANRSVSELIKESDNNLLIYPHSFQESEDIDGEQPVLTLKEKMKDGRCNEMNISTGNLAGFIGIGNVQVSIQSRFTDNNEDYFFHYMLQKVMSINIFNLEHSTSNEPVFDLLLCLFPKLLKEALKQGVYKEYCYNEYNDAKVKGVIDINQHIRRNIPFNGRIAYRTREFSYDNNITQLIRHAIEYIRRNKYGQYVLQNDADTQTAVSQIIYATPSYDAHFRQTIMNKNIRPMRHPYFTNYTALQKLCMKILRHEGLKYGNDKDKVYGVLFDVAWLWEEYLATLLVPCKFIHPQNLKGIGKIWLSEKSGKKYPRYPDFYNKNKEGIVLDAKYKRNIDERNDINQMVTYLYRLKGSLGELIQPSINKKEAEKYELLGHGNNEVCIGYYYFKIPQECASQKEFAEKINNSEKEIKNIDITLLIN